MCGEINGVKTVKVFQGTVRRKKLHQSCQTPIYNAAGFKPFYSAA